MKTRFETTLCLALLFAWGALFATPSGAALFCVSTGNQLQNALDLAANNSQDDTIRIVRGTHTSNVNAIGAPVWDYVPSSNDAETALNLSGGWSPGNNCATQSLNPLETVLNGQASAPVFYTGTFVDFFGQVNISNLTFANGKSVNSATILAAGITLRYPFARTLAAFNVDNILVTSSRAGTTNSPYAEFGIGPSGSLRLRNSTFHGNVMSAASGTYGLYISNSGNGSVFITNNSVFDNITSSERTGIFAEGIAIFSNNAVADNTSSVFTPAQSSQFYTLNAAGMQFRHNHFQTRFFAGTTPFQQVGTTTGPALWTQVGSRKIPDVGSPLRNTGENQPTGGVPGIDFSGNPRIVDAVIDRGSVEAPPLPILPEQVFRNGFE